MDFVLRPQASGLRRCHECCTSKCAKETLFEDAIRSHEKLQPQIQQSRVTQETVARMTGATSTDMGFDIFYDFVLNQAKEIDNAEAKKKVHKALKMKLNQHQ